MARKEVTITLDERFGRDKGSVFHLQEMDADRVEAWAMRAFMAIARSGAMIPDEVASAGMAGVAAMGFGVFAGASYDDVKPLLDEMLECITVRPDPKSPQVSVPFNAKHHVQEVKTLLYLRAQVFELHTGFSLAAGSSPSSTTPTAPPAHASSNTPTSRARSAR